MEHGLPLVPSLEPNLTTYFGVRQAETVAEQQLNPPSSRDQLAASLSHQAHRCAFQASANILLLAFLLTKLPQSNALHLHFPSRNCSLAVIYRHLWQQQSSVPEAPSLQ